MRGNKFFASFAYAEYDCQQNWQNFRAQSASALFECLRCRYTQKKGALFHVGCGNNLSRSAGAWLSFHFPDARGKLLPDSAALRVDLHFRRRKIYKHRRETKHIFQNEINTKIHKMFKFIKKKKKNSTSKCRNIYVSVALLVSPLKSLLFLVPSQAERISQPAVSLALL